MPSSPGIGDVMALTSCGFLLAVIVGGGCGALALLSNVDGGLWVEGGGAAALDGWKTNGGMLGLSPPGDGKTDKS